MLIGSISLASAAATVCGTCYERELPLDSRFCVIDDQVTRTWPETLELRKQLSTHVDK